MKKIITLKENRDFRKLYTRGKSCVSPVLVTYILKNHTENVRVGITTSKKTGNAVGRNRSRRIIREAIRKIYPRINGGIDLVFVSRAKTCYTKSTDIEKVMLSHLSQLGALK